MPDPRHLGAMPAENYLGAAPAALHKSLQRKCWRFEANPLGPSPFIQQNSRTAKLLS